MAAGEAGDGRKGCEYFEKGRKVAGEGPLELETVVVMQVAGGDGIEGCTNSSCRKLGEE